MSTRQKTRSSRWLTCLVIALFVMSVVFCGLAWYLYRTWAPSPSERVREPRPNDIVLHVAFTPDKESLFRTLVDRFNASRPTSLEGRRIVVQATSLEPEAMIEAALGGGFDAISPDSSVWLGQLDTRWKQSQGTEASLIGDTNRYAVSPVVIAMWEDVARSFGAHDQAIGWQEILERAREDRTFRWSHPSTNTASGLLATLAMFYAGAEKTRNLNQEDALAQSTLDFVAAVERTVRFYGEGEMAVIQRALQEGPAFLDAFVVQEQLVIYFNQQNRDKPRLVAIYPAEGTLWKDHPLVLLEHPGLTLDQRQAYQALRDFALASEMQEMILAQGYRPADLNIALESPNSPFTAANGVDWQQPKTTLQIPAASVIDVVRDAWQYTKRQTNVYLVSDVSGSMAGPKLEGAQQAMHSFVDQIKGDRERVGLLTFASSVEEIVPLAELGRNRADLVSEISALQARGSTALLDAIYIAYTKLQDLNDLERINAIVVMTDGRENRSQIGYNELLQTIRMRNQTGVPVVIFCIAYGRDADLEMLRAIAEASGGQARWGDPETIQDLYKVLSSYF